jgi:hypothetical protein
MPATLPRPLPRGLPEVALTRAKSACGVKLTIIEANAGGVPGPARLVTHRLRGRHRRCSFIRIFQRHNRLSALAGASAAKRLPLHTPTQDAVDLPKMVQVVCRFQADELFDRLPSAYLVDPLALHPPYARDRLQQSQIALAQRPKDCCRKARTLLRVTQALRPYGLIPPR